MQIII